MVPANCSTPRTGHALGDATNARAMPSVVRPSRTLQKRPSVNSLEAGFLHKAMRNTVLKSDQLKDLNGLAKLAKEHARNFATVLAEDRQIAPNTTLYVGTACTCSAQDAVCLAAIKRALEKICPELDFQYKFNCEIKDNKRSWILALHKMLDEQDNRRQTPAHGLADDDVTDPGPCLFDDIQKMTACYAHATTPPKAKKPMPSTCPVKEIDILICSTSCKYYSKMNAKRVAGSIINAGETPGGSAQTLHLSLIHI